MYSRFLTPPKKQSFFLFGARGTGKSTFLIQNYPDAELIDLLDSGLYRELSAMPNRLLGFVAAKPKAKIWIIDEVQRIPDLLPLIHQLIEKDKSLQFILTGSSARKLHQYSSDLLGGRAHLRHMHPFLAAEVGAKDFKMEKALEFGMLPVVWGSDDPQDTLRAYLALYMELEVKADGLVKNIGSFSRFLEVISFSQGNLINATDIGRECGVDRKTVQNFISILTDLMVGFCVPVFSKKAKRQLVTHEKFYFFDCGVYKSVRPAGPLDDPRVLLALPWKVW